MTALYDGDLFTQPTDTAQYITENHLTPRQWSLYNFMKLGGYTKGTRALIEAYETYLMQNCIEDCYYGYFSELETYPDRPYSNMSSVRSMRDDLKAIRTDDTIQKIVVNGKLATSNDEAKKYISKRYANAVNVINEMRKLEKKLGLNHQQRIVFNKERDEWQSILEVQE